MTKLLLSLTVFLPLVGFSQSIERSVIAASGSVISENTSGISFSQTIGEPVVLTQQVPSVIFTQGFQQPDADMITSVISPSTGQFETAVWPNPFEDQLALSIKSSRNANLNVSFCDLAGRKISADQLIQVSSTSSTWNIAVENLAAGIYLIQIRNTQGELIATHRVSKSH